MKNFKIITCEMAAPLIEDKIATIPLSREDEQNLEGHLSTCKTCYNFVTWTNGLYQFTNSLSKEHTHRVLEQSIDNYHKSTFRKYMFIAAAASILVAASIFIATGLLGENHVQPNVANNDICVSTVPSEISSDVWMTHCKGSTPRTDIDNEGNISVHLQKGRVGISANPNRDKKGTIRIITPFGTAAVLGTIFTVTHAEKDAHVEVFRGKVRLKSADPKNAPFVVSEGYGAWFSKKQPIGLVKVSKNNFYKQLTKVEYHSNPTNKVLKDKVLNNNNPSNKEHDNNTSSQATTSTPSKKTAEDSVHVKTHKAKKDSPTVEKETLDILIQKARSCLIEQNWVCAQKKYKVILSEYKNKPTASTALISIAKIELRHLKRTRDALTHFSLYNKRYPNGPLIEDAIFGMAESYKRLGNTQKELSLLQQFVIRFPNSSSVHKAKKRITAIMTPKK